MAVSTRSTGESMRAPGPSAAAPSAASVADGAAGVVSASLPVVAVDGSLPAPPYRQIVDAVLAGVASGSLARGDRLPPVRALAAELGLPFIEVSAKTADNVDKAFFTLAKDIRNNMGIEAQASGKGTVKVDSEQSSSGGCC